MYYVCVISKFPEYLGLILRNQSKKKCYFSKTFLHNEHQLRHFRKTERNWDFLFSLCQHDTHDVKGFGGNCTLFIVLML